MCAAWAAQPLSSSFWRALTAPRPHPACVQDKLNQITAAFLTAPRGAQRLEDYIGDCAALLGLRSSGGTAAARGGGTSAARAREQLAEVLEAVVQCKMDYAGCA